MVLTDWDKQVLAHYTNFWGDSQKIVTEPVCQLSFGFIYACNFRFDEQEQFEVFCTVGMSRKPMFQPTFSEGEGKRIELILYVNQPSVEIVNSLLGLVRYPFDKNVILEGGHRILGNEEVIPNSTLTDFLFIPPINESKEFYYTHIDGYHINFLWAVPIHRTETEFIRKFGWKNLIKQFIENGVDPSNLLRSPLKL